MRKQIQFELKCMLAINSRGKAADVVVIVVIVVVTLSQHSPRIARPRWRAGSPNESNSTSWQRFPILTKR